MDTVELTVFNLIATSLNNDDIDPIVRQVENWTDVEWSKLIELLHEQGMDVILFPLINKMVKKMARDSIMLNGWKIYLLNVVAIQKNNIKQIDNIMSKYQKSSIPIILFKGPVIACFYEQPEYRVISDLDLLVKEDKLKLAQEMLIGMGYELKVEKESKKHPFHFTYIKENSIIVEIHQALLAPGFLGQRKTDDWYKHIWENAKKIKTNDFEYLTMSIEDEFINQILHFATHFIYSGAKLKHLYDISLIIKSCSREINWDYVNSTLEILGLTKFTNLVFNIGLKYFKINIPIEFVTKPIISTEDFMDSFLKEYSTEITYGDQKGWLMIVWRAPILCKLPMPTFIIWIFEMYSHIRFNRQKFLFVIKNSYRNARIFKNKVKLLKKLGLSGRNYLVD